MINPTTYQIINIFLFLMLADAVYMNIIVLSIKWKAATRHWLHSSVVVNNAPSWGVILMYVTHIIHPLAWLEWATGRRWKWGWNSEMVGAAPVTCLHIRQQQIVKQSKPMVTSWSQTGQRPLILFCSVQANFQTTALVSGCLRLLDYSEAANYKAEI